MICGLVGKKIGRIDNLDRVALDHQKLYNYLDIDGLIKNRCEGYFVSKFNFKSITMSNENQEYKAPTIEIVNNRIYIDGKETVDPALIGYALLDFAENQDMDGMKIVLKDEDVFVEPFMTEV